jgi:hypothetical protein
MVKKTKRERLIHQIMKELESFDDDDLYKITEEIKQTSKVLIPSPCDQNPCAHWRSPMDMIRHG